MSRQKFLNILFAVFLVGLFAVPAIIVHGIAKATDTPARVSAQVESRVPARPDTCDSLNAAPDPTEKIHTALMLVYGYEFGYRVAMIETGSPLESEAEYTLGVFAADFLTLCGGNPKAYLFQALREAHNRLNEEDQ